MAVSSTNFVSALGTGSGIDIKALAQSLVDAERKPKADSIQSSIDKSKNRVSGYTAC
jgi:flagellar hook-associated protein 2